jgi:ABC-type sugar transport system ATPase subunit
MANIQLQSIRKQFGSHVVIPELDLDIPAGKFTVLLGPSGCGKSTILRMIAGLESASGGDIRIDDQVVNDEPPSKRGCAMVFQNYALYPHKTVRNNLAFPLRMASLPRSEIEAKVQTIASTLELDALLDRYPRQLSGGQRQRVAMGRAMIREPKVFLYDEPLSNLDLELRVRLRLEIAQMQKSLKSTAVYVTHDQTEAMTLADRIVVLRQGRIEQVGSPRELYDVPANLFVAGFVGTPKMNMIDISGGAPSPDGRIVEIGSHRLTLGKDLPRSAAKVGFRPEHCARYLAGTEGLSIALTGARLLATENLGDRSFQYVSTDFGEMAFVGTEHDEPGQLPDMIYVPESRLHFFDASGNRLTGLNYQHPDVGRNTG